MIGQNNRQDESLTGQVRNQAGHCPLTGRYFQPRNITFGSLESEFMFTKLKNIQSRENNYMHNN